MLIGKIFLCNLSNPLNPRLYWHLSVNRQITKLLLLTKCNAPKNKKTDKAFFFAGQKIDSHLLNQSILKKPNFKNKKVEHIFYILVFCLHYYSN